MAATSIPDPPAQLKAVQSYMKVAQDIERHDPVVSYWLRLYSTETALKIDRDSPDCKTFLSALILWLEQYKQTQKDNEAVNNQTVGQAHFENFAMNLFNKVDTLDRNGTANKNTVRMFYMAMVLFEGMAVFGPLTDEIAQRIKYAKWKTADIQKCLRAGQIPKPGPAEGLSVEGMGSDHDPSVQPPHEQSSKTFDIPEVPTNEPGSAPQQKQQDPFILTPSSPPASIKPSLPPSLPPGSGYSMNDSIPSSRPQTDQSNQGTSGNCAQSTINATRFFATDGTPLKPDDILQSQRYCKFANSALQYDDIPTAVANLEKALKLLTTGQKQS